MTTPKQDQDETRAVNDLAEALRKAFAQGGALEGFGFALWIIPPPAACRSSGALISNTPRPIVAEHVASWMIANKFAVSAPPTDSRNLN